MKLNVGDRVKFTSRYLQRDRDRWLDQNNIAKKAEARAYYVKRRNTRGTVTNVLKGSICVMADTGPVRTHISVHGVWEPAND